MLKVENCHIRKTMTNGLNVVGATQILNVEDTEITDVTGNALFIGSSNKINGTITRSFITDNKNGLIVNNANVLVIETTISGNQVNGIAAFAGSNILVGQSTISGNKLQGIFVAEGIVGSYGDNYVNTNTTDIYPSNSVASVARR